MKKSKVLVIGSSNVDMIMKMGKLPAKGETVTNAEFVQVYGGKGANQAIAACRAGADVTFINCVGNDAYTDTMMQNFQNEGINTSHIYREEDIPSGHALVMIDDFGDNYLSVAPGANYRLTPERILKKRHVIQSADVVLLQFEIPSESLEMIIDIANKYDKPIIFNFAPAREFNTELFSKLDTLIVNEIEAGFLAKTEIKTIEEARVTAKQLVELFDIPHVLVTLGKNGAIYSDSTSISYYPSISIEAVDSTGAGDTFCGYYAHCMAEGYSIGNSINIASVAAALSVTKLGAQPSIPTIEEVNTITQKLDAELSSINPDQKSS